MQERRQIATKTKSKTKRPPVSPTVKVSATSEGFKDVHEAAKKVRTAVPELRKVIAAHYAEGTKSGAQRKAHNERLDTILYAIDYIMQSANYESAGIGQMFFFEISVGND